MVACKGGMGPTDFLMSTTLEWPCVLPLKETERLATLDKSEKWKTVRDELDVVVSSGDLGARLFSFALRDIIEEEVQEHLKQVVQDIWALPALTWDGVAKLRRQVEADLEKTQNLSLLPEKRTVNIDYRGYAIPVKIQGVADHIDACIVAAVKGCAAARG